MTRGLVITLVLSAVLTAVAIRFNLTVRTSVGPAHFWAGFSSLAAFASWLILAMLWCTHRVVESNRSGWKKVGTKVIDKVNAMETHIEENLDEVHRRLGSVEDTVGGIDKERVQANAVVLQLFKDRQVR